MLLCPDSMSSVDKREDEGCVRATEVEITQPIIFTDFIEGTHRTTILIWLES